MSKKVEPKTLPGFMELLPAEQLLFNNMLNTIKTTYEQFGFIPLDTPIIELSEVLLAKAGGETEKQIYSFTKGDNNLALRFDLTVPLAKYVSQYFYNLSFPFRRYQIGKVYRGERPQKGRFREFYQCDIDIIGDGELSIVNDAEIPSIIYNTFRNMGFDNFTIRINNRKILNGFFESLNLTEKASDILRIVDKLEKIGQDNVCQELCKLEVEQCNVFKIIDFLGIKGSNDNILFKLRELNIINDNYQKGLEELSEVIKYIECFNVPQSYYSVDLTIARGLDYYTGTVYETILNDYPQIGSVCSGGRYDNLAEFYTNRRLPGVGISIGLTRLFYQLTQAGILKASNSSPSKVIILPMIEDLAYPLEIATKLRNNKINTEIYFDKKSMKSKLSYANKLGIPYVIIIGEDEVNSGELTIKNMTSGEQSKAKPDNIDLNKFFI